MSAKGSSAVGHRRPLSGSFRPLAVTRAIGNAPYSNVGAAGDRERAAGGTPLYQGIEGE